MGGRALFLVFITVLSSIQSRFGQFLVFLCLETWADCKTSEFSCFLTCPLWDVSQFQHALDLSFLPLSPWELKVCALQTQSCWLLSETTIQNNKWDFKQCLKWVRAVLYISRLIFLQKPLWKMTKSKWITDEGETQWNKENEQTPSSEIIFYS